jgi:predicted enzyme related to lactoylglutathione lyase
VLTDTPTFSSFAVDDVAKARDFYSDTLGLRVSVVADMGPLLTLHLAAGHDVMLYERPDFTPATYTVLNFEVGDVDAVVGDLTAHGVAFERYEGFDQDDKGVARGPVGPAIAWFTDPAGNILAVLEDGSRR